MQEEQITILLFLGQHKWNNSLSFSAVFFGGGLLNYRYEPTVSTPALVIFVKCMQKQKQVYVYNLKNSHRNKSIRIIKSLLPL